MRRLAGVEPDVKVGVVVELPQRRLDLAAEGRGVDDGPQPGERLGHVEADVGHRVGRHRQHGREEHALGDVGAARLGEDLC